MHRRQSRHSVRAAERIVSAFDSRIRRAYEVWLDRRFGVHTAEYVYLEDLGLPSEDRVWHDPSEWIALHRALRRLGPTPGDVWLDVGSGMGRALLVAARFPFRRLIGVELSEELNRVARSNLDRSAGRLRCTDVELVTADALDYDVPDDVTVVYFYSPFVGPVFDGAVAQLFASVDRRPRPLRLLYNYPIEHNRLLETGRVRVLRADSGQWPSRPWRQAESIVTYLLLPSDEGAAAEIGARFPINRRAAGRWSGPFDPGFELEKPARLAGPS
jgi:SAM-dependent methyltransferase